MRNPGDAEQIEAISDHIETTVGPIAMVFHEIISDDLHIDVHHVAAGTQHPFHALITSGMSEKPMNTGPRAAAFRFAELAILLDPSWDLRHEHFTDERNYWPIRLLKMLVRYPSENDTWLGYGHSIAGLDPPRPFAPSTELSACILLPPVSLGKSFLALERPDGSRINFWTVVPLYRDELDLKLTRGTDALMDALDRAGVSDVVTQSRPHAQAKRWRGLF